MTDKELLYRALESLYPITLDMTEQEKTEMLEKRDIFLAGVKWNNDHPYFDKGCRRRLWNYVTEDSALHPEPNKICLIKFRDGTGALASWIKKPESFLNKIGSAGLEELPQGSLSGTEEPGDPYGPEYYKWSIKYRDDIVAWSYYIGGFIPDDDVSL